MQRMRKSYREYVDDFLSVADRLLDAPGITKLPHFTTLEKFMLRVRPFNYILIGGFKPHSAKFVSGHITFLRRAPFEQ
jgi:hypothetical protein